jgi:zinc protease
MRTHVLDNGLKIVIQPKPVGLAALYLWIDAGSVDERPGEHGAAHFLEHMLFKGTARRGVGDAAAEIEALGGDLNAYTSTETTVLHATVEAQGWREGLDVLADMARYSAIDPGETEREREVVLEEIRGYESDPEENLSDTLVAAAFPDHGYGRPIVGLAREVAALPRQALIDFWRREWGADRAILSVAGEVGEDELIEAAVALFGSWGRAGTRAAIDEPRLPDGPVHHVVDAADRETRLVELQWRALPLNHPDVPALELLALAIGDGPGGAVPERLLENDALIADPWAGTSLRGAGGVLSLGFVPGKGRTAEAVQRTLAAVAEVLAEGLDEDMVGRTRAGLLADFVFSAQTVDGRAWEAAHLWSTFGDPTLRDELERAMQRTTAADVTRVAREILRPERLISGVLDRAAPAQAVGEAVRAGARTVPADPFAPVDVRLDCGARLLILPDDSPVVAISAAMRGGQLALPPRRAGLTAGWSSMITAGGDGMSAGRFSASVDRTGGEVWGSGGRSTLQVQGRFPADTALEGLGLALMALSTPELDDHAWERAREELLHDAESVGDYPGTVAAEALWASLWPDHPWRHPIGGSPGSLRNVHPEAILDWHEDHLAGDNLVVVVTGRVPATRVKALAEEWLSDLPKRARRTVASPTPAPRRSRTLRRHAAAEQAYVDIAMRAPAIDHPDRAATRVLAAILGAQGGRLFMDLRERRSLAYSVWAEHHPAWTGGVFELGLATDPARADEALEALSASLHDLRRRPPGADEVRRAARMLRGNRAMSLQRTTSRTAILSTAALFDLPLDLAATPAAWMAVTPDDVVRVADALFGQAHAAVVVTPEPE